MTHRLVFFQAVLALYLGFAPLLASLAIAEPARTATIGSSSATAKLEFNDHMQTLMSEMAGWEKNLKAAGIDATFYLGAGDLRRAILQMPADGPGDVEVFVHFNNREVQPRHLGEVHKLLAQHGIDINQTLTRTFGKEKKLDLFVKDSYTQRENKPYFGEFGFFENMGDTSLNQLIYSPTQNRIYGDEENIEALKQGNIRFTDQHKARKLEEPKKIPRVGAESEYPATILRLALRSIRLRMDLLSAPNQNKLKLDPSFNDVLKGFEHYFVNAAPEDIAQYELDDKYLEQFLKIFRNRTNAERAKIKETFATEFPNTLKILGHLGLDVDLLAKPRNARTNEDKLEFQAVHKNARYAALQPFINPRTMAISNPFANATKLKQLLPVLDARAKVPVQAEPLPPEILKLYSPDLALKMAQFEKLSNDNKLAAVKEYQDAVKFFGKPANARLLKEVTFREEHFVRFPFLDPELIDPNEKKSLLEFVKEGLAKASARGARRPAPPNEVSYNQPIVDGINERITTAKRSGKVPTVFVDLDGTLYNDASRIEYLLHLYDQVNGTHFFDNVEKENVPAGEVEHFLSQKLSEQLSDYNELRDRLEQIKEFIATERHTGKAFEQARIEPTLRDHLTAWKNAGAKIVYVTARYGGSRKVTEEILKRDGVPNDGLFTNDGRLNAAKYKEAVFREYQETNPNHELTAFFDNDRSNLEKARQVFPQMLSVRVFSRRDAKTGTSSLYYAETDQAVYKIWSGGILDCLKSFQNF